MARSPIFLIALQTEILSTETLDFLKQIIIIKSFNSVIILSCTFDRDGEAEYLKLAALDRQRAEHEKTTLEDQLAEVTLGCTLRYLPKLYNFSLLSIYR